MAEYYPPPSFHFKVVFNIGESESDNRFQEVTGITAEISTEELKEGGQNEYAHKLPTIGKYGNLVLKRGMLLDSAVIDWVRDAIENFSFTPTNILVNLLNEEHQSIAAWEFDGAFPVKLSLSDLKAEENAFAVETLELAYRKFTRKQ